MPGRLHVIISTTCQIGFHVKVSIEHVTRIVSARRNSFSLVWYILVPGPHCHKKPQPTCPLKVEVKLLDGTRGNSVVPFPCDSWPVLPLTMPHFELRTELKATALQI